MADKFKSMAATFQIFKDGEAVSVRKLDTIIRKTQDASEKIQKSLGDLGNYGLAFDVVPLFHNSIARSIGSTEELTIAPIRVFDSPQDLSSQNQGLVRYPYSTAVASDVGNRSHNLLPILSQQDKIGVGCIYDNGSRCLRRFNQIYKEEKNILSNGLFQEQLNNWETSGVMFDGTYANMNSQTRANLIGYSENFTATGAFPWTNQSGILTNRAFIDPEGNSNAVLFAPESNGTDLVNLTYNSLSFTINDSSTSQDWSFSVYMAASGEQTQVFLEIGDSAKHIRSTQGFGSIDPSGTIYAVDVSGTDWQRYYVYGRTPIAEANLPVKIHLGRGNITETTKGVYLWGAQLEPTKGPTDYIQTDNGAVVSQQVSGTWLGRTFDTIPKKWYQANISFNQVSGAAYSLIKNNKTVIENVSGTSANYIFKADTPSTNIHLTSNSTTNSIIKVEGFQVDPGTPCHALNCPGLSAYGNIRRYRATLPTITDEQHQYFGSQLRLSDDILTATTPALPGNIMGIFDHEQNKNVPERLVEWELTSWPVGSNQSYGNVIDPEFLDDWVQGDYNNIYPGEFTVISGSTSGLTREVDLSGVFNAEALSPINIKAINQNLITWFEADTLESDYSLSNGDPVDDWNNHPLAEDGRLTQGTASRRPIYRTNQTPTGKPAVMREGADVQYMGRTGGSEWYFGRDDAGTDHNYAIAIIYRVPGINQASVPILGNEADANQEGLRIPGTNSDDGLKSAFVVNASQTYLVGSGIPEPTSGTWHGALYWYDSSTDAHRIWFDGTEYSQSGLTQDVDMDIDTIFRDRNISTTINGEDGVGLAAWVGIGKSAGLKPGVELIEAQKVYNYLADEYLGRSFKIHTGQLFDRLKISAISGLYQGIEKSFPINKNDIAVWRYNIRGNLLYSGVKETYEVVSGTAEVDINLTDRFTSISGTNNPFTNIYTVSGNILPGSSNLWADPIDNSWNIKRYIKATSENTWVKLSIGIEGETPSNEDSIFLDNFDLTTQSFESSNFSYSADSILGLNWDGQGQYVRKENLFQFSNDLLLWQTENLTALADTLTTDAIRLSGTAATSGSIYQSISGTNILDDQLTLTWQSKSSSSTSGQIKVTQGNTIQTTPWNLTSQNTSGILLISGIIYETGPNLEVRWILYGLDAFLSKPQLVHGSGVQPYVETSSTPIKKYRKVIKPNVLTLDPSWAPGYALVQGGTIDTTLTSGLSSTAASWSLADTRGFPEQGVIRSSNQEYGYRLKSSGVLEDTIFGWRGTKFQPERISIGDRVLNVPIPQAITSIDPITQEIIFKDTIPAPRGDWANNINLQIYNTHINNFNRFSLQTHSIPITRATGNLLTAFLQHVADHRRHFRFSQLCSTIVDGSSWAASPFITTNVELIDNSIQELTEDAQLNVNALRFVPNSNKEVSVNWGDGSTTIVSGAKNTFNGISHTYDLREIASPKTYTIKVVVSDLNLNFGRQNNLSIIVNPKVNSAGNPTKSTIKVAAKIKTQTESITTAGAKIRNQNTSITTAGAKMVL